MIGGSRFRKSFICIIAFFLLPTTYFLLLPSKAGAVCPVCTVAVAGGLGLSRWLGIDDTVSSVWIGGLLMSVSFWTIDWLKKRGFKSLKKLKEDQVAILTILFWYGLTLIPLQLGGVIGHPLNTIFGIDKILFGTLAGSLAFVIGLWADKKIRKTKGRQLFQYQKVVFPITSLVITSLLIYYWGGYLY